jgi:hypothetical protein
LLSDGDRSDESELRPSDVLLELGRVLALVAAVLYAIYLLILTLRNFGRIVDAEIRALERISRAF